ncbi:MAG: WD40 repeat domain-containing serine/threonine protein kinase, partial [Limisphaerales bacterium]
MIEADLTKLSDPIIPDHELIRRIGRGSYGEVWLARSLLGEFRAVKIVRQDGRHEDRPFQREFEGLQKFEPISRSHAGLVHVLHAGRFAEGFFYLMELADDAKDPSSKGDDIRRLTSKREPEEGRSLVTSSPTMEDYVPRTLRHDLHQRQRLQVSECLRIALKLTEALSHLHEHGLVHRDIKPSNIIFVNGQPKLADIGLVARADATLSFVGTEGYLPPEGPGRAQADIYSLGKVLYEISTGRDRTDFPELPTLLRDDPERQELEEFNEVILKACDPDARRRYPSAQAMHADLVLMQSGQSLRWARAMQRRLVFAKKAGALVAAIALLAATGYLYQQSQTREARRLAGAESVQRARAENLLTIMELKEAESLFEKDEAGMGAAYLARVVRQNPTNQIAASRLMSALMDRSFALPIQTFKSQELMGAELSPDGRFLVSWGGGASNGVAQILDSASGLVIGKPMLHSARFWRARFSPDGRLIGTIAADGAARIWNAATGEPLGETIPHPGLSQSKWGGFLPTSEWIAFSPNSELMVVQDRNEAVVWNVRAGQLFVRRLDHGRNILDLSFSPDGQQIATSRYPEVRLWDTATGKLQQTLRVMDGTEIVTRFSPDGLRVVVASGFNSEVWDVKNGQCLLQLNHDGLVSSARFSPDGLRILTCADNRDVRLWDARSGGLIARPLKHGTEVVDAQFDSTGERILTREARRSRLWDSRTGRPLTEWMLHSE